MSETFRPVWQQKGSVEGQWQCFWKSQNPMPVLDQFVARQVGLDLSKMRTPSSISSIITDFDSSNSSLSSLSYLKGVPCLSDWMKGSMRSVVAKAYDTWFMSPNQEHTSVMFVGVGKLRIASRYFLQGQTLVEVISKPVNSTVSAPNTNLSGLRMMPLWPQLSSHSTAWKKLLVRLSAQRSVSSMHLVLLGI